MIYETLKWHGPFRLDNYDFKQVPKKRGVYIFAEYAKPLKPNLSRLAREHPDYAARMELLRSTPCLLYVGKAKSLGTRLPGYRFRPYLEIKRRPVGTAPKHKTSRHQGRAMVHANQFFDGSTYLWWAECPCPAQTEEALIRELHPVLNTSGLQLGSI